MLQLRCWLKLGSHWGLRVLSQAHEVIGRIHPGSQSTHGFFQNIRSGCCYESLTSFISDL